MIGRSLSTPFTGGVGCGAVALDGYCRREAWVPAVSAASSSCRDAAGEAHPRILVYDRYVASGTEEGRPEARLFVGCGGHCVGPSVCVRVAGASWYACFSRLSAMDARTSLISRGAASRRSMVPHRGQGKRSEDGVW